MMQRLRRLGAVDLVAGGLTSAKRPHRYRPRHRRRSLRQQWLPRLTALVAVAGSAFVAPVATGAAHADAVPPQLPFSGTVIDPGSVPAQAAIVDAYALNVTSPASIAMHLGRTSTDANGHYSLSVPLHAGMATLAAKNGGFLNVLVVIEDMATHPLAAYQSAYVASFDLGDPAALCPTSSVPAITAPLNDVLNFGLPDGGGIPAVPSVDTSVLDTHTYVGLPGGGDVSVGVPTVPQLPSLPSADDAVALVTSFIGGVTSLPWGETCTGVMNDATAVAGLAAGIGLAAVTALTGEAPSASSVISYGSGTAQFLAAITTGRTSITSFGAATGMDEDYLSGHENLDDPTLIPPFGARLVDEEWVDAPTDTLQPVTNLTGIDAPSPDVLIDAHMPNAPSETQGCSVNSTHLFPKDGGGPDDYNVNYQATFALYKCNDSDSKYDYYVVYWKGSITRGKDQNWPVRFWRYKFRTELTKSSFTAYDPDPLKDQHPDNGTTVNYSVGFTGASVGGNYTYYDGSKIHPWYDYDNEALYHVSWMASDDNQQDGGNGDCCGPYQTGGAFKVRVPQGSTSVSSGLKNGVQIWQCYIDAYQDPGKWQCDKH